MNNAQCPGDTDECPDSGGNRPASGSRNCKQQYGAAHTITKIGKTQEERLSEFLSRNGQVLRKRLVVAV
jgi:hypothetical protein